MKDFKRRAFLKTSAAQGMAFGLGSLAFPAVVTAQESSPIKWASLTPGFSNMAAEYMVAKGIDKKHNLKLAKPTDYTSITTYYNDFVAGNYDLCIGSWDTFAARYLAGVPLQYVCSITTAEMLNIIVPRNGAANLNGLQGKTLAAPQSTGIYRVMRAIIKEINGVDLEKTMTVQNVDNPAAAVTLVMSDRADAGISWEPSISAGLKRVPDMRVIYSIGEEYRKKFGIDLPYLGLAVRKERVTSDPGLPGRIDRAFGECLKSMVENVDEALAIGGKNTGVPPDVLKLAISSGRQRFKHVSMLDDKGRESVRAATNVLVRNGLLPRAVDDGFFAS
jgi:NitT/TauT family transport system substrate-binding protein